MIQGAKRMLAQGRKIVIFPQGTRVAPGVYAPYRVGIAALYEALDVPIVPMALNSGVFWARPSVRKTAGTTTVELLPPIPPALPAAAVLARLDSATAERGNRPSRPEGRPPT